MGILKNHRLRLSKDKDEPQYYPDDGLLLEASKPELKRPALYQVIMLNDDYTPMEFVVHVLEAFFNMDR